MVYETGFTQELTTDEDNVRARGSIEFDDWSSLLDDIARETIKNATETARPLAQTHSRTIQRRWTAEERGEGILPGKGRSVDNLLMNADGTEGIHTATYGSEPTGYRRVKCGQRRQPSSCEPSQPDGDEIDRSRHDSPLPCTVYDGIVPVVSWSPTN